MPGLRGINNSSLSEIKLSVELVSSEGFSLWLVNSYVSLVSLHGILVVSDCDHALLPVGTPVIWDQA